VVVYFMHMVAVVQCKVVRLQRVGTGEREWHFEGFQQLRVCKVVAMCVMGISGKSAALYIGWF